MSKQSVGEVVFNQYERRLEREAKSSQDLFAEETAADLVLQSPYVTDHLIAKGVIRRGEHSRLTPVFNVNLKAQMHGAAESKGYKITVKNAHKRAATIVEHSMRNHPNIMQMLRERRKSEYDLFYGFRSAAFVESIQCDYIAGVPLSKPAETAAGIALYRRFGKEVKGFRKFLEALDVDINDDFALRQFSEEAEMRQYVQQFYSDSLYFQRREGLIVANRNIVDLRDNVNTLERAKTPIFTEGAIAHAISKLRLNTFSIIQKIRENRA